MTWFLLLDEPKNCGTASIRGFLFFFRTDMRFADISVLVLQILKNFLDVVGVQITS